ncbi:hypothetical protein EAE96_003095 [Botrytis aclada]|nr:hypothetical protein EAE96_003095 [Botrytis aclada]
MSSQPSQPSSLSTKLLPLPASHKQHSIQPPKPNPPSNNPNPHPGAETPNPSPSPFLHHALLKKKKKDLQAAREEARKKSRETEEGKRLFGGMVAEVWRARSELKIKHPDVADSVLEQEAWKLVFY